MRPDFAENLVADFWRRVGSEEPFPRHLERSIMLTTPVFVVKVHRQRLDTAYIRDRLQRRGISLPMPWAERKLNGCLVAFDGEAAIFLDGTLQADEARVILAHEFGHYLADYEWPRQKALRYFGNDILPVLDGARPAQSADLLAASLSGLQIGAYVHYMDRSTDVTIRSLVSHVEDSANAVGAELVAPRKTVFAAMAEHGTRANTAACSALLKTQFGLPQAYAALYAAKLMRALRHKRSFTDVLGF